MPTFFERRIIREEREYKISFGVDDAAIMENSGRFEIKGYCRKLGDSDWQHVTLTLDVQWQDQTITVLLGDRPISTIKIPNVSLPDSTDFEGADVDIDAEAHLIDTAIGTHAIEEIIHWVPTDPFLGCIIKGALSTSVGQIIRCWPSVQNIRPYRDLASKLVACLWEHSGRMLLTFIWRAGRCAALHGLR